MTNIGKDTSGSPGEAIRQVHPQPRPGLGKFGGCRLWRERGCNCHAHCTTVHQTPTSPSPHELRRSQPQHWRHRWKDATPDLTLVYIPETPGPVLSGPKQSLLQVEGKEWGPGGVQGTGQFPFPLLPFILSHAETSIHPFLSTLGTEAACLPQIDSASFLLPPPNPGPITPGLTGLLQS